MTNYKSDILILGAGAAGISATAQLALSGQSLSVIEARDRIGGRIFTIKDAAPFPLELGAEYLHGKEKNLWNLIEHYQLRLAETDGSNWFRSSSGLQYDSAMYTAMVPVMDALLARAKQFQDQVKAQDQSLSEFARELKIAQPHLATNIDATVAFIEDYTAAPAQRLSLRFVAKGELASHTIGQIPLRPLDGYIEVLNKIADRYLKPGQLHLNTRVQKIEWSAGAVFVTALSNGKSVVFEAKKLLITLPVGVLKLKPGDEGSVQFVPPLKDKQEALNGLEMGKATRVVATFKRRFWSDLPPVEGAASNFREFGFVHCQSAPIPHWWSQYPVFAHQLIGWVNGPSQPQISGNDKNLLRQSVITSLSQIFAMDKTAIDDYLADVYSHNWNDDPYTMGVYCYCLPNYSEALRQLAEPVEGTLFFAGEATEKTGFSGTVHGALRSGFRAAEEILRVSAKG